MTHWQRRLCLALTMWGEWPVPEHWIVSEDDCIEDEIM